MKGIGRIKFRYDFSGWRFLGHNHSHRLFLRFLVSYLVVLFIPIIIGTVTYNEALSLVKRDLRELNLAVLKQSKDVLNNQLAEVETLVQQLSINPQINKFVPVQQPLHPDDYYKMKQVVDEVLPYKITRDFIYDFLIYFKNSDYIISSDTVYEASFFKVKVGDNPLLLNELKNEQYRVGEYLPVTHISLSKNSPAIPYVRSLPFTPYIWNNRMEGTIMVLINDTAIRKLLTRANIAQGGWAYIADRDGNVITGVSSSDQAIVPVPVGAGEGFIQKRIAGQKMIVTYTTSNYNQWKYIAVVPARTALAKVNFIQTTIILFVVGSLLAGIFLAYYLTYHNTEPLQKIIGILKNESLEDRSGTPANAYQYLQGSIAQLITSNKSLQETMRQQRPLVRAALFDQILIRGFNNQNEINTVLNYLGFERQPGSYLLMVVQMYAWGELLNPEIIQELDMAKVVVKEVVTRQLGERVYLHDIDPNKLAVLLTWDPDSPATVAVAMREIETIQAELLGSYNIRVFCGVSAIHADPAGISQAYEEAKMALDYKWLEDEAAILWYHQIPQATEIYYYPIDLEQRLLNLAQTGEFKPLQALLEQIAAENLRRKLAPEMHQQLVYAMKGSVLRIISQMNLTAPEEAALQEPVGRIDQNRALDENLKELQAAYALICARKNEQKTSHAVRLQQKILDYIDQVWNQPDLCLQKVAAQFSLTEGYLSHFFKDQTGENFTTYLEKLRITKACELLRSGRLNVAEVAEQVGYNSPQAFRRAFKRVTGINPSGFSEQQ